MNVILQTQEYRVNLIIKLFLKNANLSFQAID